MALSITIRPAEDGWAVRSADLGQDLVFASGGRAEAFGRALAARWALEGHIVELEIILRDETVAAVIPFGRAAAA
jgi:hypothetical protein